MEVPPTEGTMPPQDGEPPQSEQSPPQGDGAEAQAVSPQEAQMIGDQLSGLFASGNPKHALGGLADGVRNTFTGLGMGVASAVGATASGYHEEGWMGGAKGAGLGLLGLVGFTGYGLYTGGRQALRGIVNTPEAVSQASRGEAFWDSSREQWVRVDLATDLADLPTTDDDITARARERYRMAGGGKGGTGDAAPSPAASPSAGGGEGGGAADYYTILGVPRTATAGEIKKAFTQRALVMHPDKNPNDPDATVKFQELLSAYNVLSNEASRAQYDSTGSADASSAAAAGVNPMEEVLGLQFLEPLVGRLSFAAYFEPNTAYDAEMWTELHLRRRLRIARTLCGYLDNAETGMEAARVVLRDAVSTRAGPQLVAFAADAYRNAARQHLSGSAWRRECDSWYTSKMTTVTTSFGVAASGARTIYRAARGTATEEDVLAMLVAANESDVRRIVLQASRLTLYDTSVSPEVRTQRAHRLEELAIVAMEEVAKELATRQTSIAEVMHEAPQQPQGEQQPPA